jgi:hypothetical protein
MEPAYQSPFLITGYQFEVKNLDDAAPQWQPHMFWNSTVPLAVVTDL